MSPALHAFFETMGAFLDGVGTPADVEALLGQSTSAPARLQFYQTLMQTNAERLLSQLYAGTRDWLERHGDRAFARVAADYTRAHHTEHWDLNAHGAAFSDWLREAGLPPTAVQLADYEWAEYLAGNAADPPPRSRHNTTAQVRMYTRPVHQYARAARRGERPADPSECAVALAIFRHPARHQVVWLHLERAQLFVLAHAMGELSDDALSATGETVEALHAATRRLREEGVLLP